MAPWLISPHHPEANVGRAMRVSNQHHHTPEGVGRPGQAGGSSGLGAGPSFCPAMWRGLPAPTWALAPLLGSFPLVRPSGSPVLILYPNNLGLFPQLCQLGRASGLRFLAGEKPGAVREWFFAFRNSEFGHAYPRQTCPHTTWLQGGTGPSATCPGGGRLEWVTLHLLLGGPI